MSARKKWDLSVPPCTDYYSPKMNVSSCSDSYDDGDRENDSETLGKFNHLRKTLDYRSPLTEVNHNAHNSTESASKVYLPEQTKSCPNQYNAIKKKRAKCKLPYNLRKTPERLLRLIGSSSSTGSGEFGNANENLPTDICSPLVLQPDVRILRNRSMHLASTAKKYKHRVSFSVTTPIEKEFSPIKAGSNSNLEESLPFNKSKMESNSSEVFHTPTDNLSDSSKHENAYLGTSDKCGKAEKSDISEVFHTPTENLQNSLKCENLSVADNDEHNIIYSKEASSVTMVNTIANLEVVPENSEQYFGLKVPECESEEPEQPKRGSYVVTDSKFNPCDLPHTPAVVRKSPRSLNSSLVSDDPSLFQVNFTNPRSKRKSNKKRKKSTYTSALKNKSAVKRRNTVCQPFHLITDERYPKHETASSTIEHSFNSTLRRNNTPKVSANPRRTTKVSPFKFSLPSNQTNRKRPHEEDKEDYKPLAERVAAHFKTPIRFRTTSRLTVFQPPAKKESPEFVRPKTPKLHAVKRRRTVNFLSHEQQLELEAIEMRKHPFKATPFNPKILNPPANIKERKPPTVPEEFHLETEKRVQTRKYLEKMEEEPRFEFRARKVPKSVLQGPMNVEKTPAPRTLPRSPRLSVNERAVKWKNFCSTQDASPEVFVFKAKPAPVLKSPKNLKSQANKTTTTVQPFTFHEKDKVRFANKEKKIQEELEEKYKAFRFQATEIPAYASTPRLSVSQVEKKPPTMPQPFNLHPGNYSSRKRSLLNRSDYEVPKVPSATKFKAKPATVLRKKPFIPRKSLLPVVESLKFDLHTEKRAKEWARQSEEKKYVELEKEEAMKKFMQEQEEREREEIRQLRQELVHKAQPVPKYRMLEIKPSDKPATTPRSPPFATKQRLMHKLSTT